MTWDIGTLKGRGLANCHRWHVKRDVYLGKYREDQIIIVDFPFPSLNDCKCCVDAFQSCCCVLNGTAVACVAESNVEFRGLDIVRLDVVNKWMFGPFTNIRTNRLHGTKSLMRSSIRIHSWETASMTECYKALSVLADYRQTLYQTGQQCRSVYRWSAQETIENWYTSQFLTVVGCSIINRYIKTVFLTRRIFSTDIKWLLKQKTQCPAIHWHINIESNWINICEALLHIFSVRFSKWFLKWWAGEHSSPAQRKNQDLCSKRERINLGQNFVHCVPGYMSLSLLSTL